MTDTSMLTASRYGIENKQFLLYSPFQLATRYLKYFITAANGRGHGTHSPFVFNFIKQVLNDDKRYPEYAVVEGMRRSLLRDHTEIEVLDLGAGSGHSKGQRRRISEIAKNAAKPARYGQLLFRIARYFRPAQVLELGSSLGISTAYLALGNRTASTYTIEGSPSVAEKAVENLRSLKLDEVMVITGDFDSKLTEVAGKITGASLVFVDGNHRKAPTLQYFNRLLPLMKPGSVLIFDDIHWSLEMEEAWETIRLHPGVIVTIDLFFIGLVFFEDDFLVKQHFIIRY